MMTGGVIFYLRGDTRGVDERILELVDEQWSIGDFVLTGGELAAMMMIDSIVRVDSWSLGRRKVCGN